jgi:hypothetical protein
MSTYPPLLSDRCTILNRTVTSGMRDTEKWTAQAIPVRCRVMKQINRRRTSSDSAEKVKYGTFVFTNIVLPKTAVIEIHDRISHENRIYDVMEVSRPRNSRTVNHLVAFCEVRA